MKFRSTTAGRRRWPDRSRRGLAAKQDGGGTEKMGDELQALWREGLDKARSAPRCGARRRDGKAWQAPAMRNGRCRMHGGKSTGPRTAEGLERSRKARWRHGHDSAEAKAERREARASVRFLRELLAGM
jgi:hypothetical protein